jgi:hypothetical protein
MKEYLRRALFDALSDLGEQNRALVIYHIQKNHGIRFTGGYCPTVAQIESALRQTVGRAARIFIERFEKELEKYTLSIGIQDLKTESNQGTPIAACCAWEARECCCKVSGT